MLVMIEGYKWPLRFKDLQDGSWFVTRWEMGIDYDKHDDWIKMGKYEGHEIEEAIKNFKRANPGKYGRKWNK